MKNNMTNIFAKLALIACIAIAFTVNARAEDKTITLDYSSFNLTTSYATKTATVGGFGFTVNQGYKGSGKVIQMNSSKGSGILYNTTAITGLKSITVNVSSGNKTYTITTGSAEKPTANSQTGTTGGTYNASSGDTFFQLRVSGASYFSSIVITYDNSSSESTLTDSDLAITGAPVNLSFDLYNNSSAQTVSFTSSSTGNVTISESEYIDTSISDNTITVTPVKVTPSEQTITVSQAADNTYKAGAVSFTFSITDSTPAYTVTFSDTEDSVTEAYTGAGITLPTRVAIDDYIFAGWSATNISTETTVAPTILTGTYHPTNDITLYPVYTKTVGGSGTQDMNCSVSISSYATANNWTSDERYTSISIDDNVSVTGPSNGNNSKYYSSSPGTWRFYANDSGYFTVATSSGDLTSVTITYTGNALTYGGNNITSATAVSVSGSSATFSVSGSSSNTQVSAIAVAYTITGTGTTYYWSSPVAATVKTPVITVAENPFLFSTTATITCETDGASIKYSYDQENWSEYSSALTVTETKTIYAQAVKDTNESSVASVTVTKNLAEPTVTIDHSGITNTDVYTSTYAGVLSAAVTYNNTAIEGATVSWSGNNDEVATIDATSGAVTLVSAGTVTFTATYAGDADYSEKTETYEMTVINSNAPGTQNNPYTVAQARAAIDAGTGINSVYATGIVSQIVTAYNSQYGNISYNISTDGTTSSDQLQAYRGKGIGGENFTSDDDIQVGDVVVIYGNLKKYNSTYEFDSGNRLVSLDRPVTPIIVAEDVTIEYDATSGEIPYSISNSTSATLAASCSADWVSNIEVTASKVTFTATSNEENADRTATFTLTYTGATDKTITVTQKHYVVDYATLPFEWEGGASASLLALDGVSASGLGSDYAGSNAPYLVKLDTTGDFIMIKTDSRPGSVSIGVKMLGGTNTSTITVQGSPDGETFTDVEELTISGTSTTTVLSLETSTSFAEDDRFVKLYFTKGSNVGVGPISIASYVAPSSDPSITVSPDEITPSASFTAGTIDISYANLTISNKEDFDVLYCDSEGTEATKPSWVSILVTEKDPSEGEGYVVSYTIQGHEGAERSAYFKVYALGNTDYVYSNLVTITQAEYVADYAGLPFTWKSEFGTAPTGITINGSTEAKNDYLNMKGTGAEIVLKINETPGTLSFDIRGNSFSDGTFKVQTSANGVSYTDLATYTELGTVQSEEFSNFTTNVRYIKWVYTEKVNGNVGIGNISLTKAEAAPDNINLAATSNGNGYWVSFFNGDGRYDLPDGAQAFTLDSEYKLYRLGDGKVIPQGVAVILIADKANITLKKSDKTGVVAVSGKDNESILLGSDSPIAKESGKLYYVLGIKDNIVGFYKYNGAKLPAGKAYYTVTVSE